MRIATLSLVLFVAILAGCDDANVDQNNSGNDTDSSNESITLDKGTIGYSAMDLKNPFFNIIAETMEAEGKKHGYKVVVNDAVTEVATQAQHIDNYIAQKVVAIVINPVDRVAIGPAIKKANEAGIPVFTNDLQCVAEDVKVAGHIGTDNFQGGKLAGGAMVEALGEEGGDVLILHFEQANSCVLRVDGFLEVIKAHNKDREEGKINIADTLNGEGKETPGFNVTSDALQTHKNLRGIFAINDPSALGAWRALEAVKLQDQVKIVGFDGQKIGKQGIKDGKIYADPIQFPDQMGVVTVQNIIKYLDGEEFEEVVLIPTELYTKADADKDPDLE